MPDRTRRTPGADIPGSDRIELSGAIRANFTAEVRRSGVAADGYSAGTLDRWQAARERALPGRRDDLVLDRDPVVAADQLAAALKYRAAARHWLLAALEVLS